MPLRIVIADDHPLVARGIARALDAADDIEVVGEAASGSAALAVVARTRPDMVLMDMRMPDLDGLACLERIRRSFPDVKVAMLSACDDREQIDAALRRGACAYILKTIPADDIAAAIRQARRPSLFHAAIVATPEPNARPTTDGLTDRELVILRAVARGLSNGAIARELYVTEQTVKFHVTNVFRKLGVTNRTAAARYAHQHGLVETTVDPEAG